MNEFAVQAVTAERTPQRIGEEIRSLTYQAKGMTVYYGVEIGRRLVEAKKMVGHGAWGEWVRTETEFSQSTATRFMKVFEEYGANQIGIFGAVEESSTLQKISISNALRLLAVPKEEREEFAEAVDAEHISARELEKVIRERDEAQKKVACLEKDLEEKQERLSEAEQTADAFMEEVEKLKARPVDVAVEKDEAAIAQAAKNAKAAADKEWEAKLKDAEQKLSTAEKAKAALEKQVGKLEKAAEANKGSGGDADRLTGEVEALKKQLAMSGAETVRFKTKFEAWQESFAGVMSTLQALDAEGRGKMKKAVMAQLDAWKQSLEAEEDHV